MITGGLCNWLAALQKNILQAYEVSVLRQSPQNYLVR